MTICQIGWDILTLHVSRLKLKLVIVVFCHLVPTPVLFLLSFVEKCGNLFFHFNIIYVAVEGVLFHYIKWSITDNFA